MSKFPYMKEVQLELYDETRSVIGLEGWMTLAEVRSWFNGSDLFINIGDQVIINIKDIKRIYPCGELRETRDG
jgi:hypothetical protein